MGDWLSEELTILKNYLTDRILMVSLLLLMKTFWYRMCVFTTLTGIFPRLLAHALIATPLTILIPEEDHQPLQDSGSMMLLLPRELGINKLFPMCCTTGMELWLVLDLTHTQLWCTSILWTKIASPIGTSLVASFATTTFKLEQFLGLNRRGGGRLWC